MKWNEKKKQNLRIKSELYTYNKIKIFYEIIIGCVLISSVRTHALNSQYGISIKTLLCIYLPTYFQNVTFQNHHLNILPWIFYACVKVFQRIRIQKKIENPSMVNAI